MKRTRFLLLPTLAMLLLLVGLLALLGEQLVHAGAASTTVTNCHDSGPGSLRNTLASAPSGSTITFHLSCVIKLESTLIIRTTNLTLDGKGQQVTLDGQNRVRVLKVNDGVTFTLNALTIAHGATSSGESGAGLLNLGTVRISDSTFAHNTASEDGGGLFNSTGGRVTISKSTFAYNTSAEGDFGAGLDNDFGGTVTISNSTFAHNSAPAADGGGLNNFGTMRISNSTVANNAAPFGGGGGLNNVGTLTISNSTFAHNSAFDGGGIDNEGTLTMSNSTIANNAAGSGGGILGTVSLAGSIVANNTGGNCADSPLTDQGYNLSSDSTCHFTASTSLQNTAPKLDPAGLQDNGGPTQTIALQPDSPAVDRIPVGPRCPATDQRGVRRPQGPKCDIGAFEMTAADGLTVMIHVVNSFQLNKVLQSSLDSQLQSVLADVRARHTAQACRDLTSFSNYVKAQSGKGLTGAQATTLLKEAAAIHTRLGC